MAIGLQGHLPLHPRVRSVSHFRGKEIPELVNTSHMPQSDLGAWLRLFWESYDIMVTHALPNHPEELHLVLDDLGGGFRDR
jgi:hypothetical protein